MILVTGSEGLIGKVLIRRLHSAAIPVRRFDIRRSRHEDVCDPASLEKATEGVEGVVHLAAVSRVVWAQNDPAKCQATNVEAIHNLVEILKGRAASPWIISASSREVYGQASRFPVAEDSPLSPMNTYARSKVEGERIMEQAREAGITANICRFSNVYGYPDDHPDRVVNAFARAAAFGGLIRVEGPQNTFDFTFADDVGDGLFRLVVATRNGSSLPPLHFVSGEATTLLDLSRVAKKYSQSKITIMNTKPRDFDVSAFVGDPARTRDILGWHATTSLHQGFEALVQRHIVACNVA